MRGMLQPMFFRWFLAAQLIISCNVCMECLVQEDVSRISSIWTSLYIRRDAFRLGATRLVSSSELLPVPPCCRRPCVNKRFFRRAAETRL